MKPCIIWEDKDRMTEHINNTKKILNLTAVAALTAAAGVTVANQHVHAATVNNTPAPQAQTQHTQTPQEQYQTAQDSANAQISNQASANASKEQALANQNTAANAANAQKTNDAVKKLQDQIAKDNTALKQQNDADYAAKQKSVNSAAASDTKAENDQYAQDVQKQQAANAAAEQAQAQANAKALADAAKNTYTPAQKQSMKDDAAAKKQADMNSAQAIKDQAQQADKDALNKAQANAQTAHDQAVANQKATNQSRLDEANAAYKEAVKNAPKTGVVTPAEPEAHHDDDTSDGRLYPNTDQNNHNGLISDYTDKGDPNTVHGINQLDFSGKPGWLYYDPESDDTEAIDIHNLTSHQKEILNQYAVDELNALRNWFVNNIAKDKKITFDNMTEIGQGHVNQLHVTDNFIKQEDFVNDLRTKANADNTTHTVFASSKYPSTWGENMIGNDQEPTTLLQALVEIHNAIENLAYNELTTSEFQGNDITLHQTIDEGHLGNILSAEYNQAGVIYDHDGTILLEFAFDQPSGPDVNTPEISQILAAQSGQGTPDLNAPAVKAAAQHVKDVEAQNAKDLAAVEGESLADTGQDAYKAAMKQADDNYNDAVAKINAAYDAEIKRINALPSSTADLKAALDQKLADLKKTDAAKLTALKKAHEDKLATIKANAAKELKDYKAQLDAKLAAADPAKAKQIADLKAKHEAFVKANAKKLADLQAADTASLNALKAKLNAELAALHAQLFPEAHADNGHQGNGSDVAKGNSNTISMNHGREVVLPGGRHGYVLSSTNSNTNSASTAAPEITAMVTPSDTNSTTNGNKNSHSELPQTGNENSGAVALLGAMATMLGLGVLSKKREY